MHDALLLHLPRLVLTASPSLHHRHDAVQRRRCCDFQAVKPSTGLVEGRHHNLRGAVHIAFAFAQTAGEAKYHELIGTL